MQPVTCDMRRVRSSCRRCFLQQEKTALVVPRKIDQRVLEHRQRIASRPTCQGLARLTSIDRLDVFVNLLGPYGHDTEDPIDRGQHARPFFQPTPKAMFYFTVRQVAVAPGRVDKDDVHRVLAVW